MLIINSVSSAPNKDNWTLAIIPDSSREAKYKLFGE